MGGHTGEITAHGHTTQHACLGGQRQACMQAAGAVCTQGLAASEQAASQQVALLGLPTCGVGGVVVEVVGGQQGRRVPGVPGGQLLLSKVVPVGGGSVKRLVWQRRRRRSAFTHM